MQLSHSEKIKLAVGAIVGAVLGAGAVWTLMQTADEPSPDELPAPISPKEILTLTGTAAALIKGLIDFRHRLK